MTSVRRVLGTVVAATTLLVGMACDQVPTEPPVRADQARAFDVILSAWQDPDAAASDLGTWRASVLETREGGDRSFRVLEDVHSFPPVEGAYQVRRRLARLDSLADGPWGAGGGSPELPAIANGGRYKPITAKDAEGRRVRIHFVPDLRDPSYPPSGMVVFIDNRFGGTITFERDGDLRPTTIRGLSVDGEGQRSYVESVVEESASTVGETASASLAATVMGSVRSFCSAASEWAGPAPLMAADVEECGIEAAYLALAAAEFVAATAAVGIAAASCTVTLVTCPAHIAAVGFLAIATAQLAIAQAEYDACQAALPPPTGDPIVSPGAGSNFEPDAFGCIDIIWEISYDDGGTWHYYARQRICE